VSHYTVTAKPYLRVRSGAGTSYAEIGRLPEGTRVSVLERRGSWAKVETTAHRGWVHAAYIKAARPKWRLAASLRTFFEQVDGRWPARKRKHDGTIGDAAHASRSSDHNPREDTTGKADGVVTALDLTDDPDAGCDCDAIAVALVASKDPRIKYIIWRGRIVSSKVQPWKWRPYTGENKHMLHLHLSVDADPALHDDDRPWALP
jgi:uncharacterized protein YraI